MLPSIRIARVGFVLAVVVVGEAQARASVGMPVSGPSGSETSLAILGLALVGGLILNLMPCVFPVLGLKILSFVSEAGQDRRKVIAHGLLYTAGVLLSFWGLAGVLFGLRVSGAQLGWGFQLQSPGFVFILAIVMLVLALSLSGVFEFGLGATSLGSQWQNRRGYLGTFFTGVLATVVATPCSAPFLAPALGAAVTLSLGKSFAVFTAIALGLAWPYLALSILPQAVRWLPRPGAWMETFKQAMAFPLFATVAYLLWVLAGQTTANGSLFASFGLTAIAMAVWCYGRYTAPGVPRARTRRGIMTAVVLFGVGAWAGWPQPAAPTEIVWQPWSPEAVTAATAAGKTVYIDFTARWCATCQTNKKLVFSNVSVKRRFRERNIIALEADWTNADPRITAELAKWGRSAVPFNLVVRPGEPPQPLPSVLTPSLVLEALKG
jgi:thiol:disulfide interchange protein DsbD